MPTIPTRTKPTKDDLVEVLDDVPEDEAMMSSLWVSPSEGVHIDVQMSNDPEAEETITFEVYTFAEALSSKAEEGNLHLE
jgi:leucyl-tRNA synthetase